MSLRILCFLFGNLYLGAQCFFTIEPSTQEVHCQYAVSQVVWKDLVNSSQAGQTLTKTAGGNNWGNGGAASTSVIGDNGWLEVTASQTNTARMVGLSNSNANANYTSISFAIYLRSNGQFEVFESGTSRGAFGSYALNDVFKIKIDDSVVKYYRNNVLFYVSAASPTLPLLADAAINTQGGTISNALLYSGNTGTYQTSITNAGTGASYQWLLNGNPVGTNSSTYTNNTLVASDILTCEINVGTGGCTTGTITSNSITIQQIVPSEFSTHYITSTPSEFSCYYYSEPVRWQALQNMHENGTTISKGQGGNSWGNGGAFSSQQVLNNGSVTATAIETNTNRMFGLSASNPNNNYTSLQFALYFRGNGTIEIYENGNNRGSFGTYASNDVGKVAVENGVVKYYKNATLLYVSQTAPTFPLYVDASFDTQGGSLKDVIVTNGMQGTFNASAPNLGPTPSYHWKLNGADDGINSPTYAPASLNNNDIVTCEITPDLNGCNSDAVSNTITIFAKTQPSGTFYSSATATSNACYTATEYVHWRNKQNMFEIGDVLSKGQGGNSWGNGGAFSVNGVYDNGSVVTTIQETNTNRMMGLSVADPNTNYTSILYALYFRGNGTIEIYESGNSRGSFGTYAMNDIGKVAIENGVVKYYKNNTLLYVSQVTPPSYPLFVDVAFDTQGGTLKDVKISNRTEGQFSLIATGIGTNPSYQWKLNGMDVGANSANYNSSNFSDGDVLTTVVSPDLGACSNASYTTKPIEINLTSSPAGVVYATNVASANACYLATEKVTWTSMTNMAENATGTVLYKIQGGNSWGSGGAASLNLVYDNGYVTATAQETNTNRMFGLSVTNSNNNYTSILYALYFRGNGTVEVYESGNMRGAFGAYVANDVGKVSVEDGVVKYYKNNSLLYVSQVAPPSLPMLVDVAFDTQGGTLKDVEVTNGSVGSFILQHSGIGASPSFQWKQNGTPVGTNSASLSGLVFQPNDVITCEVVPDVSGCASNPYVSRSITIKTNTSPGGNFYATNIAADPACYVATEQVTWTNKVNVHENGTILSKGQGGNAWGNGGAASFNTVSNNGYVTATATETNTNRMFGLSVTNTNANYTTIAYALYFRGNGTIEVYESGNLRGSFGTYTTNDVGKVAIENNVVKYYKNSTLLYVSQIAPTLPMIVDVAFDTQGGTLKDVEVSNGTTGNFAAVASGAGVSPSYQWKLNGVNTGTNSSTQSITNLQVGDQIVCDIIPDLGGCGSTAFTTRAITIKAPSTTPGTFYATNVYSSSACYLAAEKVTWTSQVNLHDNGTVLSKSQGGNAWGNGGASTLNQVYNNGFISAVAQETNTNRMIGLSNTDQNANYTSILYALYFRGNGTIEVYESGNLRGAFGAYAANDTGKVKVEQGVVKYYRNSTLLYVSNIAPTLPLIGDVAFDTQGGTLKDVEITNQSIGQFTVNHSPLGTAPTYQWKINGLPVGANSSTLHWPSITDGDVITCEVVPDLAGCSNTNFTTRTITIKKENNYTPGAFYISSGVLNTTICPGYLTYAEEEVRWQNLSNVTASGNSLLKLQGGTAWNAGAGSYNQVHTNGYMYTIAQQTNTNRMIGLSATNPNVNFTSIQFALYLRGNGNLEVYENGTLRGSFGAYTIGDTCKIEATDGIIKYFRNSTLLYTSLVAPTFPLIVDASLETQGATLPLVAVGNITNATFTANTSGAGPSPGFQWKLNGINVGTSTPSYSNSSLNHNDQLLVALTPDIPGCTASSYNSNLITIKKRSTIRTSNWFGLSNNWAAAGNWSNGVPDQNTIAVLKTGTANNPQLSTTGNVFDLVIENGVTFTIAGTNTLNVYRNWNSSGNFVRNSSTVHFRGCVEPNTITTLNPQSFHNVIFNNTNGILHSSGNTTIMNNANFTNGIVTQSATFNFADNATASNSSNSSHIDGPVIKTGNDAFAFPVGDNGIYQPISISAPSSTTDQFTAQFIKVDPDPPYDKSLKESSILSVIGCDYWNLDRTTGSSDVSVTLSWGITSCGVSTTSNLIVARWDGALWKHEGANNITGTTTAGTIQSNNPVSGFGPFTLAINDPLPVQLVYFKVTPDNKAALLHWQTASEHQASHFELERSIDGLSFETIATITAKGNSPVASNYSFLDHGFSGSRIYYRLKIVDVNGDYAYSEIIFIQNPNIVEEFSLEIYPNPAKTGGEISMQIATNDESSNVLVVLTNPLGQVLYSRMIVITGANNSIVLIDPSLKIPPGTYFVTASDANHLSQKTIVVQ